MGPLDGLRVIEFASEYAAFAGKLLADLGAEVVLVEPPEGHRTRRYEPFVGDEPHPERSLWWWHYNTSKVGVILDLFDEGDAVLFQQLVETADIVLEAEAPGLLSSLHLDYLQLRQSHPGLIWASVTPFGRETPRSAEQAVDLTIMAAGGPVWSCGYDDHALPPVRGAGNQGYQIASLWAVMGVLTAVLHRDVSGSGQLIDVNMHAASNVTTEMGSYAWLVARQTVQRQTGRHAMPTATTPVIVIAADGREVNTGSLPRTPSEFRSLLEWLGDLGILAEFDRSSFLEIAAASGEAEVAQLSSNVQLDPLAAAILEAARDALSFIASQIGAYDYFVGAQERGLTAGIVYAPEEVLTDPHFVERGFPVAVSHDDVGMSVTYPGAPFVFSRSPWRLRHRAPHHGEHQDWILGPLRV